MISDRLRNVDALKALNRTSDSEIDVFQVRLKVLIEPSQLSKQLRSKDGGGEWGDLNYSRLVPHLSIRTAVSATPGRRSAADRVIRSIEVTPVTRIQDFSTG